MTSQEVIFYSIPGADFGDLIEQAIAYALISLPFTIDRMGLDNASRQIKNIAKGKIAEKYFEKYCRDNGISVDFKSCSTPFWKVDKRDFLYAGKEWDIKNNFIYHDSNFNDFIKLPALVPNRRDGDQWSKRDNVIHNKASGVNFLFTFMKGASLTNGNRGQYFFDISISKDQLSYIQKLVNKYKGLPQSNAPFSEKEFFSNLKKRGPAIKAKHWYVPDLVIACYSNQGEWQKFKDTGPYSPDNHIGYNGRWYQKIGSNNSLKFLNGEIWTRITNATAPVEHLPSFKSMIP